MTARTLEPPAVFLLKLLALAYGAFLISTLLTYLVALYERARRAAPGDAEAHIRPLAYLGQVLVEAGATLLTWLLWPLKFLERAAPVRVAGKNALPVVFVHGYHGHSATFWLLRSRLRAAGLDCLMSYNYRATAGSIEEMARELGREVERVKLEAGAERVDLVGHSLGGLLAQYYVAHLGGEPNVRRALLLAPPLAGTWLAPLFPRHAFELFHPAGPYLAELQGAAGKVRETSFVSIYSTDENLIVPPESSHLEGYGTNHPLSGLGHNSLLFSSRVAELVRSELMAEG